MSSAVKAVIVYGISIHFLGQIQPSRFMVGGYDDGNMGIVFGVISAALTASSSPKLLKHVVHIVVVAVSIDFRPSTIKKTRLRTAAYPARTK